jgi:hypothetical protein
MSEDQEPPQAPPIQMDYSQPPVYSPPSVTDKLIPTSNPRALLAYYLGIFGLVPGFCLFLSPAAIVYGVIGLKAVKSNPQIGGKSHALAGIILGTISLLGLLAVVIWAAAS